MADRKVSLVTISITENGVPRSATLNLQGLNDGQLKDVGNILPLARELMSEIEKRNKLAEGH